MQTTMIHQAFQSFTVFNHKTEQGFNKNRLYELKTLIITFALGEKLCIPFFSLSDPSGPNALPGQGRYGFQVSHRKLYAQRSIKS